MGFYSSAIYYRPGYVREVRSEQLKATIEALCRCELVNANSKLRLTVDFGSRANEPHPTDDLEAIVSPPRWKRWLYDRIGKAYATVSVDRDYQHDIKEFSLTLQESMKLLSDSDRRIARADVSGEIDEVYHATLSVPESEDSERPMRAWEWGFSIGPCQLCALAWDQIIEIGNVWFSIGGPGYFFPMKFPEWVRHNAAHPAIVEVCRVCRDLWPIKADKPPAELIQCRREIEGFWAGEDPAAAVGWDWGPQETG